MLEGIRAAAPAPRSRYVRGCDVTGRAVNEIAEASAAAGAADVAVVVVGENEWQKQSGGTAVGTSGEGRDVATLELTGLQEDLVRAVVAAGTPTVVVLVNGRPLATRWIAENVPAIVEAWIPGERGGQAVAEVLFGDYDAERQAADHRPAPRRAAAGRLRPAAVEGVLDQGRLGQPLRRPRADAALPVRPRPRYTTFELAGLRLSAREVPTDGTSGRRRRRPEHRRAAGTETVQVYVRDIVSSVTTPVQRLRGFRRVSLAAGEAATRHDPGPRARTSPSTTGRSAGWSSRGVRGDGRDVVGGHQAAGDVLGRRRRGQR